MRGNLFREAVGRALDGREPAKTLLLRSRRSGTTGHAQGGWASVVFWPNGSCPGLEQNATSGARCARLLSLVRLQLGQSLFPKLVEGIVAEETHAHWVGAVGDDEAASRGRLGEASEIAAPSGAPSALPAGPAQRAGRRATRRGGGGSFGKRAQARRGLGQKSSAAPTTTKQSFVCEQWRFLFTINM